MSHRKEAAALITLSVCFSVIATSLACTNGECKLQDECSSDADCAQGLICLSCSNAVGPRCVRAYITDQFKLVNNSLPFNKYAFLTTHNAFAIDGEPWHDGIPRFATTCQEDNVTEQLNHGVRALMLDTYDFEDDVWLCHSFKGKCYDYTAFKSAFDTFKEIEAFLSANPSEIVTLILEDYVKAPNALTRVFNNSGLMKYWFPVSKMPQNGQDWPLVKDMVASNQRLLVFSSSRSKQETEGIAYQWNYMVENQYGSEGIQLNCTNRGESASLDDKSKSLVLLNHFGTIPVKEFACQANSASLIDRLHACYAAAGNRWANFIALNYYKRSDGGGGFQALDTLNGELICGCNDLHACVPGSTGPCN